MPKLSVILRYAVSALLAAALAIFGGGWLIHEYVGHEPAQTVGLTVIRGIRVLSHLPGQEKSADKQRPKQMLTGFVQVGFTVGPDGRAHGIHVIRAEPPGRYEEAARELIAARHFKPSESGHAETRVVHFQVPATVLRAKDSGAQGG